MTRKAIITYMLGVAGICGIAASTAQGEEGPKPKTFFSKPQPMGQGTVRTYVTLANDHEDESGRRVPTAVGIEFPSSALQGLSTASDEEVKPWIIYFPPQARETPFQYTMIDWNPQGHPPSVYQLPHFDFHFYIQDLEEVMNIKPGPCSGLDCDDFQTAMKPLPPQYAPAGYINVGAVEPFMGNHLVDPTSPEFQGNIFTRTFIYGTYDGKLTFEESMITRAFLLSKPAECKAYPQPQEFGETGYWPTKYCTTYDAQTDIYHVSLEGMKYHTASGHPKEDR